MANEIQLISDGDGWRSSGIRRLSNASSSLRGCRRRTSDCPGSDPSSGPGLQVAQAFRDRGQLGSLGEADQGVGAAGRERADEELDAGLSTGVVTAGKGKVRSATSSSSRRVPGRAVDQPGGAVWCRGAHGAARDAADHGRDHRLSRHDRREARRRAPRPEGRRAGGHDRSRLRHRGGHDHPRARWPGQRGHVVEGAGHVGDDRADPGVRVASARRARREAGAHRPAIGDLAKTAKEAEAKVQEWLAVLARCFQLQDAIAVLELDRVLDAAPDELDGHRLGLRAARQNRLETISQSTERLMARMDAAAGTANAKVLLNPTSPRPSCSRATTSRSPSSTSTGGSGSSPVAQSVEARGWADAATEFRDKVLETGAEGVDAARRLGNETFGRAKSVTGKLSSGIAGRALRVGAGTTRSPRRRPSRRRRPSG